MLTLASALQGKYRLSFVCPPSPTGLRLVERARKMGLPAFVRPALSLILLPVTDM